MARSSSVDIPTAKIEVRLSIHGRDIMSIQQAMAAVGCQSLEQFIHTAVWRDVQRLLYGETVCGKSACSGAR